MNPILVAGTGSWKDDGSVDWYCPGHPFVQFLTSQGVGPTFEHGGPFIWSTDLAGIPGLTNVRDWAAGGAALAYFIYVQELAAKKTAVIAHSHGLQVAAYAAAEHGIKFDVLFSMGSPIRKDMQQRYEALRRNTRLWIHVHSDGFFTKHADRWQLLGELFDGHFGVVRNCPLADRNDFVPKVGHSELLRDPVHYHYWLEKGWINELKG